MLRSRTKVAQVNLNIRYKDRKWSNEDNSDQKQFYNIDSTPKKQIICTSKKSQEQKNIEETRSVFHIQKDEQMINEVDILSRIARRMVQNGRKQQALLIFQEVLRLSRQIFGQISVRYSFAVVEIAEFFQDLGFLQVSIQHYQLALAILSEINIQKFGFKQEKEQLVIVESDYLQKIGEMYKKQEKYREAINHFKKSYSLRQIVVGPGHYTCLLLRSKLRSCRRYIKIQQITERIRNFQRRLQSFMFDGVDDGQSTEAGSHQSQIQQENFD